MPINNKQQTNTLAIAVLISNGLGLISVLIQLVNVSAISGLAKKPPPTMAQLETGQPIAMTALNTSERTPETIQYFVITTLHELFSWNNRLDFQSVKDLKNPKTDKGIATLVQGNKTKIPTSTWRAGFAVSDDFRKELQENIASLIPKGVFNGREQVILLIDSVSEPQELEEGKWKVTVKANLNFLKGKALKKVLPFHKEVFVEAVDVPALPKGEDETEQAIFAVRLAGLQIFHIRDVVEEIPE